MERATYPYALDDRDESEEEDMDHHNNRLAMLGLTLFNTHLDDSDSLPELESVSDARSRWSYRGESSSGSSRRLGTVSQSRVSEPLVSVARQGSLRHVHPNRRPNISTSPNGPQTSEIFAQVGYIESVPNFTYNTSSSQSGGPRGVVTMDSSLVNGSVTSHPISNTRSTPALARKRMRKPRVDLLASAYAQIISKPSVRSMEPKTTFNDCLEDCLMASWANKGIHSNPVAQTALKDFLARLTDIINRTFDKDGFNSTTPRYRVEPFGSVSWDGTTGHGDLDLVILDSKLPRGYEPKVWRQLPGMPAPPPLPRSAQGRNRNRYIQPNPKLPSLYNIDRLANRLQQAGMENVQSIKWASVPIVKFIEPTFGWQCDINVNELGGWFNSQLILAYCNVNPLLVRPMIHTLKVWAAQRAINDPSGAKGLVTLSSYTITIMAIAFLQIRGCLPNLQDCTTNDINAIGGERKNTVFVDWQNDQGTPINCCFKRTPPSHWVSSDPSLEAGDAVRLFFAYFATTGPVWESQGRFDYGSQALSVLHGGLLNRVRQRRAPVPGTTPQEERVLVGDAGRGVQPRVWFDNKLVIQDPFIHTKNLARSITKNGFNAIVQEINRAHNKLAHSGLDAYEFLCQTPYE